MRRARFTLLVALTVPMTLACGPSADAPPPDHPEPARADARKPASPNVEVINSCAQPVPIYLGEEPNGTTGSHATLRGGGTSHLARDENGELVFWIVDDKGFGKAHVRVTKRMRKVEIGPSCETLHAE